MSPKVGFAGFVAGALAGCYTTYLLSQAQHKELSARVDVLAKNLGTHQTDTDERLRAVAAAGGLQLSFDNDIVNLMWGVNKEKHARFQEVESRFLLRAHGVNFNGNDLTTLDPNTSAAIKAFNDDVQSAVDALNNPKMN